MIADATLLLPYYDSTGVGCSFFLASLLGADLAASDEQTKEHRLLMGAPCMHTRTAIIHMIDTS